MFLFHRQSQDRYGDGTDSLKGFPDASAFEGEGGTPVIPMETMSLHKDFEASELAHHQQQQMLMGSRLLQQPSQLNGSALG